MSIALARRACALLALVSLAPSAQAQFVSYTGTPVPPQPFAEIAASGTSSTLPNGWYLDDPDDAYLADDGNAQSGNGYSYGSSGSTERALGSIASNSTPNVLFGVQLQNDTGATLTSLDLAFRVELWRRGDATGDRHLFAYSTDATSLATGTWTSVAALDLVAPTTAGSPGPRDGNATGNFADVASSIGGFAVAPGAKFWLRWSDGNASGADDGLAIDDVRIGPAGDFPPFVANTTPTNNATGVAATTNVTIGFSEPVVVSGAWNSIECTSSGAHPALASGGPQTVVLDPTTNFTPGEQCTVAIVATQVVDQDGTTADPMAADYAFSFTIAPDLAPAVASTVPANGAAAVAVAGNVTITFSEDVSVAGNWYAISCSGSGAHPATVGGGPRTYALDPTTDFALGESCTVTIAAANVTDLDGSPDPLAADYSFSFQTAQGTGDYYANVDTTSAATMRATLHETIDDHDAATYFEAWTILEIADQDPLNPARILDVYRNRVYTKVECRSGASSSCPAGASNRYNREHTWPNSHGFNDLGGLDGNGNPYSPYTDTHMLYLSAEDYNANRGNKYYANCPGCAENPTDAYGGFGGGTGTYPGNSNWSGAAAYETWNHRKGDVARALLYMDVRYEGGTHANGQPEPNLIVTDDPALADDTTQSGVVAPVGYMGLLSVLVQWHNADPPDAQEQLRNDVVYSFQGNRNPFIDHPEWVACMYGGAIEICPSTPTDALFRNGFE